MGKRKARKKKQAKKKQMKQEKITMKKTHTHNNWSKANCHTGQSLIFTTHEGIEVWAGGKNRNGGWHKMSPLPQLAMGPSETLASYSFTSSTEVPEGWSCEQQLTKVTPPLFISFDWPDFGTPKVSAEFWYAMVKDIRTHNIKSISTQCAGGHGRTGVQLAILRYLLGTSEVRASYATAADLIDWVRDAHCHHAVEAESQQKYIAAVCGIPEGESKIHSKSHWSGSWGSDTKKEVLSPVIGFDENWRSSWFDDDLLEGDGDLLYTPVEDEDKEVCPCCGHTMEAYCDICGYDSYEGIPLTEEPCVRCGKMTHEHTFTMLDGYCIPCHAQANNYKVKITGDEVKSTCAECKTSYTELCFNSYDSKLNGLICHACDSGVKV